MIASAMFPPPLVLLAFLEAWALAAPQNFMIPACNTWMEYKVEKQYPQGNRAPVQVGAETCTSNFLENCQIEQGKSHTVGITGGVSGGADLQKVLKAAVNVGFNVEFSTEDTKSLSTAVFCPKGGVQCGLQYTALVVKTEGKARRVYEGGCGSSRTTEWENFWVEAPVIVKGGPHAESNIAKNYEACFIQCKTKEGVFVDTCPAKDEAGIPDCPEKEKLKEGKEQKGYKGGWCTGHIRQYQKPKPGVDKYRFDVDLYDADKQVLGRLEKAEVDNSGRKSMGSKLPWTLEIVVGDLDENFVSMCYSDQCWQCDDNDGGAHGCTLGNGKHHGYEDGNRDGDFGFTC